MKGGDRHVSCAWGRRLLAFMILTLLIGGCASRGPQSAEPRLAARPGTVMRLMPFSLPEVEGVANDAGKAGLLGLALDSATGMYTYKFDDEDFKELRSLLLRELAEQRAYDRVVDGAAESAGAVQGVTEQLLVDFSETGISEDFKGFTCTLKAHCRVADASGATIVSREVSVAEKSMMTVGKAKIAARAAFARQVMEMIAAMP